MSKFKWKVKSMFRSFKIFAKFFVVYFKSSANCVRTINDKKVSRLYYSFWSAKNLANIL